MTLFDFSQENQTHLPIEETMPLAARLRPKKLSEIVGQKALLAPDGPIQRMVRSGNLYSFILWGPPGCGKTTLARALAHELDFALWSSLRSQALSRR